MNTDFVKVSIRESNMNTLYIVAGFSMLFSVAQTFEFTELKVWPDQSVFVSWPPRPAGNSSVIYFRKADEQTWTDYQCTRSKNTCLNKAVLYNLDIATYVVNVTLTLAGGTVESFAETIDVKTVTTSDGGGPNTAALIAFLCIFLLLSIVLGILVVLFWRKAYLAQTQGGNQTVSEEPSKMSSVFAALPFPTKLSHSSTGTKSEVSDTKQPNEGRTFTKGTLQNKLQPTKVTDSRIEYECTPPLSKKEYYNKDEDITTTWVPPPKKTATLTSPTSPDTTADEKRNSDTYMKMGWSKEKPQQHEYLDMVERGNNPVYVDPEAEEAAIHQRVTGKDSQQEDYEVTDFPGETNQVVSADTDEDYVTPVSVPPRKDSQHEEAVTEDMYEM